MSMIPINPEEIRNAYNRISKYLNKTPVLQSDYINEKLGAKIYFKFEGFQKTGAFKLRGALNTLLTLKEQNNLPAHIVAFSSGNHAQAVAYAAKMLGVKATIFIPSISSKFKIEATKAIGAEVILSETRQEAEAAAKRMADNGAYYIHPYDNDYIIQGQGTACYEALQEIKSPDAIFVTIGGGGWISGSFLAARLLSPASSVIGGEPRLGNDAYTSYKTGKIHKMPDTPKTIADGARTLAISERTFQYIRQLKDVIEIEENAIIYWVQILALHLKITAEPTSCVAAAACAKFLSNSENKGKTALVMLSGGNMDYDTHKMIWQNNLIGA